MEKMTDEERLELAELRIKYGIVPIRDYPLFGMAEGSATWHRMEELEALVERKEVPEKGFS
jgi:hypothetical protein